MITASESTGKLAADGVAAAAEMLRNGDPLNPFLITEADGLRDIEHFDAEPVQEARSKASLLCSASSGGELCALVYKGRVGMDQAAILVEVHRAGETEVEVFSQAFRPARGRLRPFKLMGELTLAGRREALA